MPWGRGKEYPSDVTKDEQRDGVPVISVSGIAARTAGLRYGSDCCVGSERPNRRATLRGQPTPPRS
jgi:hypothetical protein